MIRSNRSDHDLNLSSEHDPSRKTDFHFSGSCSSGHAAQRMKAARRDHPVQTGFAESVTKAAANRKRRVSAFVECAGNVVADVVQRLRPNIGNRGVGGSAAALDTVHDALAELLLGLRKGCR
jgi:hypothetical protein